LSGRDRQALEPIEAALAGTDPQLVLMPGWQRTRLLLWLVISLALITAAVVLSRASPGNCARLTTAACAGRAGHADPHGTAALHR
jgi:hypothetical protein